MRVFLTGATGFIGSHIVPELVAAGHHVIGMTRSAGGAEALLAAGAEPYRADLTDLERLARDAAQVDAVIHTAFDHDFTKFAEHCAHDRAVIRALAAPLTARGRPLIITSGTGWAMEHRASPPPSMRSTNRTSIRASPPSWRPRHCWPQAAISALCGCRRCTITASRG